MLMTVDTRLLVAHSAPCLKPQLTGLEQMPHFRDQVTTCQKPPILTRFALIKG